MEKKKNKQKQTKEVVITQKVAVKPLKKKLYIPFEVRYFLLFVLCLGTLCTGFYCILKSMDISHESSINFKENGQINYKVCLKKNNFYEEDCLASNMSYVASLIDTIPLSFHYELNQNLAHQLTYEITGKLVIASSDNAAKYFEKTYVLQEEKTVEANTFDALTTIDYDYYNDVANQFKSQYGLQTSSYLEVYLNIKNDINQEYSLPSSSQMSVKIPLSLKAIQINLSLSDIHNEQNVVLNKKEFTIQNSLLFLTGLLLTIIGAFLLVLFIQWAHKIFYKKSAYDKALHKILKEYDRLIVETKTLLNFDDYQVMKISAFLELVDVRDNLGLPIMYYNVVPHQKCHFYIVQDKNIYLYTLKDVDLKEGKNEN